MLPGRLRLLGLSLLLLLAVTGCRSAEAGADFTRADVAVPSYLPPAGAPGYCAALAGSTELGAVAGAIGVLTVTPGDVEAQLDLSAAVTELKGVRATLQSELGSVELEAELDDLVTALQEAAAGTVTDSVRAAIIDGLDAVGQRVQPECEFPV